MNPYSRFTALIETDLSPQELEIKKRQKNIKYAINILRSGVKQIENYISEDIEWDGADIFKARVDSTRELIGLVSKEVVLINKLYERYKDNVSKLDRFKLYFYEIAFNDQFKKEKVYKKGPATKRQNTKAFWDFYRQQFYKMTNDGMTPAKAKNIIGLRIEKNTGKKPHRTTLYRQLVSSGK